MASSSFTNPTRPGSRSGPLRPAASDRRAALAAICELGWLARRSVLSPCWPKSPSATISNSPWPPPRPCAGSTARRSSTGGCTVSPTRIPSFPISCEPVAPWQAPLGLAFPGCVSKKDVERLAGSSYLPLREAAARLSPALGAEGQSLNDKLAGDPSPACSSRRRTHGPGLGQGGNRSETVHQESDGWQQVVVGTAAARFAKGGSGTGRRQGPRYRLAADRPARRLHGNARSDARHARLWPQRRQVEQHDRSPPGRVHRRARDDRLAEVGGKQARRHWFQPGLGTVGPHGPARRRKAGPVVAARARGPGLLVGAARIHRRLRRRHSRSGTDPGPPGDARPLGLPSGGLHRRTQGRRDAVRPTRTTKIPAWRWRRPRDWATPGPTLASSR